MNKRLSVIIYFLFVLFFNFSIFSNLSFAKEESEDIERVKALLDEAGGFHIKVEVEGEEVDHPIVVDGTTIFIISRPSESNKANSYKLCYFFEGRLSRVIENVLLPYEFTQTYRGLLEGSYKVSFVLESSSGNYGSYTFYIYVKHNKEH